MTPEEIARVNQQIPGFAGMSPQQQQDILKRLSLRNTSGTTQQQPQAPTTSQQVQSVAVPMGVQAGLNSVMGQSGYAASGSLSASGSVPAAGSAGTASGSAAAGSGFLATTGPYVAAAYGIDRGINAYNQAKGKSANQALQDSQRKPSNILSPLTSSVGSILGSNDSTQNKVGNLLLSSMDLGTGTLSKLVGGKKDKDQQNRDQDRATLKAGGVLDDQYNLTLSDGSKVNLGLDGSVKNYNVDFNEKGIGDVVALVNPFAYLVTGGDTKRASDLAGQLTNAFKGSKDPLAETKALFEKAGLYKEDALARIDQLKVDDQTKNIFKATINKLGLQSVPGTATQTAAPSGGFKIVVNQVKAPTPKPVDNRPAIRNSILQNMLQQNTQPLQYPRQDPNYKNQNFNGTLQKLVGI